MRIGKVLPAMLCVFAGIINLVYLNNNPDADILLLLFIDLGVLLLCISLSLFINRNLRKDLLSGKKKVITEIVVHKEEKIIYEAGSGSISNPILGTLFPKYFNLEMRPLPKYYLRIKNFRYPVDKELFQKVKQGDSVDMHYTINSNKLLGIYIR